MKSLHSNKVLSHAGRILILTLLMLLWSGVEAAATLPANIGVQGDWCSPLTSQPDVTELSNNCEMRLTVQEIASRSHYVTLGTFEDTLSTDTPNAQDACGDPRSHAVNKSIASAIRTASGAGKPPRIFYEMRMDLLTTEQMSGAGFQNSWLLTTATPWATVVANVAADTSAECDPEGTGTGSCTITLGNFTTPDTSVYYMTLRGVDQSLQPLAVMPDMGNAAYRAWRIARIQDILVEGGFDGVALNEKFDPNKLPDGYWMFSTSCPNLTVCNGGQSTIWSAQPQNYPYGDYVAGWVAFGEELTAAGIPFITRHQPNPALHSADDPLTTNTEYLDIRALDYTAEATFLSTGNVGVGLTSEYWYDLYKDEGGNPVMIHPSDCGLSTTSTP